MPAGAATANPTTRAIAQRRITCYRRRGRSFRGRRRLLPGAAYSTRRGTLVHQRGRCLSGAFVARERIVRCRTPGRAGSDRSAHPRRSGRSVVDHRRRPSATSGTTASSRRRNRRSMCRSRRFPRTTRAWSPGRLATRGNSSTPSSPQCVTSTRRRACFTSSRWRSTSRQH